MGIPYELWDNPSAEITELKTQCETLLEQYEHVIEDWYFNHQENKEKPLIRFLCEEQVLSKEDAKCLDEVLKPKGDSGDKDDDEEEPEEKKEEKPQKPKRIKKQEL